MDSAPRILITTASFGEGHNTASKNLALVLEQMGATTRVVDCFTLGMPKVTRVAEDIYRRVTTRMPRVWGAFFQITDWLDQRDSSNAPLAGVIRSFAKEIEEFQPHAIVSPYPLYPYFMGNLRQQGITRLPVFVVVTDSIEIHSLWTRAPGDQWLVTDPFSVGVLTRAGIAPERVWDTGFPVHPCFATLTPLHAGTQVRPFRVLFFPTTKPGLRPQARAILDASPDVHLTMVLGKNTRAFLPAALAVRAAYPGRVRLIGWTRRVPALLARHHLVVGKAGGASVHEAIAAQCPMLIHQIVPGQEEGNLKLLEALGAGASATTPLSLRRHIADLLRDDATGWRMMKHALARYQRCAGAQDGAQRILARLAELADASR